MPKFTKNLARVEAAFSREDLARICVMDERDFAAAYDMHTVRVDQRAPFDFYHFRDNGSNVLAVAHLDTVADASEREAHFIETSGGPVVYSRALDDRLGAYIILELLPALGIQYDVLLTTGEENGESTAAFFDAPDGKYYDWIIEFDRGGTDVVMYDYEDDDTIAAVRRVGARVGDGIFSDISYMEHMGVKGWNWGVGYRDYHGPRAHAYLDDTMMMVARFLNFHHHNEGVYWEHVPDPHKRSWWSKGYSESWSWDDDSMRFEKDDMRADYTNGEGGSATPCEIAGEHLPETGHNWRDCPAYDDVRVEDFDYHNDNPSVEELRELEDQLQREREHGLLEV